MKDQNKCFIFGASGYEEITYSELKTRRECEKGFDSRRFIRSSFMLMEVSEADYKDLMREERRQKYIDYESVRVNAFSIEELSAEGMVIVDTAPQPYDLVSDRLMLESMISSLDLLNSAEREIIQKIFFDDLSEREVAKELGISQPAVHKRLKKAIGRLKIFLEI